MADQLLTSIGVEVSAAGGRPALRRPLGRRRARRLAGRHRDADDARPGCARPGIACSRRAAADDRRRRHRRDGRRRRSSWSSRDAADASSVIAPDGVPEVGRRRRPGRAPAPAWSTSPTATSSRSPARSSARPRAGWSPGARDEAIDRRDRPGRRPARPTAIVRTRHGPGDGRRRGRRLQRRARHASCCCPRTRTPRRAGSAPASPSRTGRNVGVVVTDTAGRAWRKGQTDLAIGAAGLPVARRLRRPRRRPRQRARGDRTRRRRRDRRRRPSWSRASSAAARSPWSAAAPTWSSPPGDDGPGAAALVRAGGRTCSASAPARPSLRALRGDPATRLRSGGRRRPSWPRR